MSEANANPAVVLFEDRPKQSMVFQLNLNIYLDARVTVAAELEDLKKALAVTGGVQLIVVRSLFRGASILGKVKSLLGTAEIPVICLGDEKEIPGVTIVGDDSQVRPLLQAAARLLGITARQMVNKQRPNIYEISPGFLNMLFTFPCDVFDGKSGLSEKLFSAGDAVSRPKISRHVRAQRPFVIESIQRLKLANAVAEQALKASAELESEKLADEKKMSILAASIDMVAAQFQNAGMDEETVKLANSSIKAIEKIADSATSVGNLVKQLMAAEGGYRYAHCQLLTFLGFHVIKMMGWWGDDQRAILSQAAFYHDISLNTDEDAKVRTPKMLAELAGLDPKRAELILTHAQKAARELQTAPEISPEVVRVVIQHHGSPLGKGFSQDLAKLDNLAKTFVLAEEWGDYLIHLAEDEAPANNDAKLAELKEIYKDDVSRQIIETFRYLDTSEFTSDFLTPVELDFSLADNSADPTQTVRGATDVRVDEEILVKGGKAAPEEERRFAGGADASSSEEILVKGVKAGAEEKRRISGSSQASRKEDVTVRAHAGELRGEEKTTTVKGERESDSGVERIVGAAPPVDDGEVLVRGEAVKEDAAKRISGVTTVQKDEAVLIKDANPQGYVDRSITRIKGDTPEKEKELKMKSLTGVTDLMKAALSGSPEKVTEILTATPNELRKTDAEGRPALHYAAMGGSVPTLQVLLAKGAQLNMIDAKRRSALFLATMHKHNEAFDFLLAQGAKINQQAMGGMTVAMIAAFSGNMHILKIAVQSGVRLDTRDHNGKTVIDFAKQGKATEAIVYLDGLAAQKSAGAAAPAPPPALAAHA